MRITSIITMATISSLLLFSSCKKDLITDLQSKPTVPVVKGDTTPVAVVTPVLYKRTIKLGTGSGNLTIDGTTLGLQCSDLLLIKGGTYGAIDIKNILSADGCPITIKNDGLVQLAGSNGSMTLTNLNNVTISGDGTTGTDKGFLFTDIPTRAIQIYGTLNNFTLQYVAFKNIGDHSISYIYRTVYTGAEDSYSKNLKFLHISSQNTHTLLSIDNAADNGSIKGLVKNIEIAYLDFKDAPSMGNVVYLGLAEDYDIHNNRVDNVNTALENHNGIFGIQGTGKFHDNYISNHQGNGIRAWGISVGTTPKTILIYNNIITNSRKYSGFEVQAFSYNMIPGLTTYANAIVFNNTCANLNISNDWQGNVVDVYGLQGGKCDVYNNLAYNFQSSGVIAGQEAELIPNQYNNLLFKTSAEAGIDPTTFKLTSNSPAKNKGIKPPMIITDYYGSVRNPITPSVGAVE